MSEPVDTARPTEPPPGRVPGEGGIPLESTAGNAQLELPARAREIVGWESGKHDYGPPPEGRDSLWGVRFQPRSRVPRSGVYNVVDSRGNYLRHQITCHEGDQFPPDTYEELVKKVRDLDPQAAAAREEEGEPFYGFELAYEAKHLAEAPSYPSRIFLPGEDVPVSGVYNVVDRDGNYLFHQRAWVKGHDEFGPTKDPAGHGYVLAYPAEHLFHR